MLVTQTTVDKKSNREVEVYITLISNKDSFKRKGSDLIGTSEG